MAADSGDFAMDGLECDGKFPVKKGLMEEEEEEEEEDEGGDNVRKIQVSGGNLSLVVDFCGSLNGISSDNAFEFDGRRRDENLVKANGYREDETQEVLVGNLVWVMTKYRKWWPGEVVDFRADAEESFMVRYIGQSHLVSWFAPSKLKPFKESFEQLLNQRNDKEFFVAVEKAMSLLGNSLKLDMTCSCIAEGNGVMSAQKGNSRKTKPLILREFSVDRLEPTELVTQLKNIAKCVSNAGILETTVMHSRLSAFYSFVGHKQIPMSQLHENEGRKSFTAKMNDSQFIGSPSIVAGKSRRRFRKEWFRKFVSEADNVSARDDLVNVPSSDLMSKLKLLAVDYKRSEETEDIGLFEWFFSKFRISVFHDENAYKMQLANMAGFKDLMLAKDANPGTEQKTSKSKKLGKLQKSEKLKIESLNGVSTPDNEHEASKSKKSGKTKINHIIGHSEFSNSVANEPVAKDFQEKSLVQFREMKAVTGDTLSRPVAPLVPDLNSVYGTQFVSSQPASVRNFTNADLFTSSGKKKRGRKRKNAVELQIVAHASSGIPDLNGITTEPTPVLPQVEPTQRRRRRKKEESPNGLTRGITILFLKFSSQVSMPSRDDLTSTFSAFGPLDSSETHVSEECSGAQVAFVSSGDAIEAVKSLEKANPFGETLVNFRLQQKPITVQKNVAPRMPVISHVSPVPKLNNTPMSVDSMRQNLMMMTAMLENSGDSISREMKAKLKSDITGLLEKVSSMPSSSSS